MTCENYTNNGIPVGIGYDSKDRAKSLMELSSINVTTVSATNYLNLPASSGGGGGGASSLETLNDVCITKPINNNSILIYSTASSCWANGEVTDVITPITTFVGLNDVSAGLTLANHPGSIITVGGNSQLGVSTVAEVNAAYVTTAGNTHLSSLVTSIEASTIYASSYAAAMSATVAAANYVTTAGNTHLSSLVTSIETSTVYVSSYAAAMSATTNSHTTDTTIHFTSGALGLAAMAFQATLVYPDNYTAADGYSESGNDGALVTVNGDSGNLSLLPSSTFALAADLGSLAEKSSVVEGDITDGSVTTDKIDDDAVNGDKIAAYSIDNTHVASGMGNWEQHNVIFYDHEVPNPQANGFTNKTTGGGFGQAWEGINTTAKCVGCNELRTGTAATNYYSLLTYNNVLLFNNGTAFIMEYRVNVEDLADATDDYTVEAGFGNSFDAAVGSETDYAFWTYRRATDGDFWVAATARNGTETKTVTAVAPVGDNTTFVVLRIEVPEDGSEVRYYLNDTLEATHTTNVPQNTDKMGHGIRISKTAGTTQRTFRVDWHRFTRYSTSSRT